MATSSRPQSSFWPDEETGVRRAGPPGFSEMLAREGAPWRPFRDKGVLIKGQKAPRNQKALFGACERLLLSHLRAVCLWPEKERNRNWRVGDHSFYIVQFSPATDVEVYAQLWSEPDEDGAIFEVVSGAQHAPTANYVTADKREMLRDRGFEIGGNADNFRKIVSLESPKNLRAVARELIAVLTGVMGYDGTQNLTYTLNLESASVVRHVMTEISPYTLEKLLREWGFAASLEKQEDHRPHVAIRLEKASFGVDFLAETKNPAGRYQVIRLQAFRDVKAGNAARLAGHLNELVPTIKVRADSDHRIVIEMTVVLHGGVTLEHLQAQFEVWRGMLSGTVPVWH